MLEPQAGPAAFVMARLWNSPAWQVNLFQN
jgi:hypothetical protein